MGIQDVLPTPYGLFYQHPSSVANIDTREVSHFRWQLEWNIRVSLQCHIDAENDKKTPCYCRTHQSVSFHQGAGFLCAYSDEDTAHLPIPQSFACLIHKLLRYDLATAITLRMMVLFSVLRCQVTSEIECGVVTCAEIPLFSSSANSGEVNERHVILIL